jgi:branched-chain amino acid transport system ATP-binding protein
LLEARGCTVSFAGLKAVSDFSLQIAARTVVGLIGPNGAGKTTVFNMLTGIYQPTAGEILFDGHNLRGRKPAQVNRLGMARTFQNIRLFANLTAYENVLLCCHAALGAGLVAATLRTRAHREAEARARSAALEILGELGLEERADERAVNLSYGDQRRLEIARAIISRPRIILLDEPVSGVSAEEAQRLRELLIMINRELGITMVVIEHNIGFLVSLCQRISVMTEGHILAEGDAEAMVSDPRVRLAYFGEREAAE